MHGFPAQLLSIFLLTQLLLPETCFHEQQFSARTPSVYSVSGRLGEGLKIIITATRWHGDILDIIKSINIIYKYYNMVLVVYTDYSVSVYVTVRYRSVRCISAGTELHCGGSSLVLPPMLSYLYTNEV